MKKWLIWALILISGFSLFAQTARAQRSRTARRPSGIFIYIMPVTGQGSSRADNDFISGLLADEVTLQNYFVTHSPDTAGYLLIATIGTADLEDEDEEDEIIEDEIDIEIEDEEEEETPPLYFLTIQLQDNKTKIVLVEQDLFYQKMEDIRAVLHIVMRNIFSQPLEIEVIREDDWRNKYIYARGAAIWTPRIYKGEYTSTHYVNFGASFSAEYQFLNFMSAELGFELSPDWIINQFFTDDRYLDLILSIPVLIKYTFKPTDYFMLQPYTGIQFNVSLFQNAIPPVCTWLIGFQYGVKAGPGVFFIEPRVGIDLGRSSLYIQPMGIDTDAYKRTTIYIGFGYKYGFLTRGQEVGRR